MTQFNALQRIKNELRSHEITLEDSGQHKFAPTVEDIRRLVKALELLYKVAPLENRIAVDKLLK